MYTSKWGLNVELSSLRMIFSKLNKAGVRYLVVGGLAVVAHGYLRFTAGIDLFIDPESVNLAKAVDVFTELGFKPRAPVEMKNFINAETRESWVREKNLKVFSLWNPASPRTEVDIFVEPPLPFEKAEMRSKTFEVDDQLKMRVVGLDDLIQMKLSAGRRKDIDDVENLRKVRAALNEE